MFDDEENNTDFSAEVFLGAILRKEREMSLIFGNKESKKDTTLYGSSTSTEDNKTLKDNKKIFEKEAKGDTKYGSSISTKGKVALKNNFENKKSERDTTKYGSSTYIKNKKALKDNIEEQEKHTTYNWGPTSSRRKSNYKFQSRSEYEFSIWNNIRMKSHFQKKESSTANTKYSQV